MKPASDGSTNQSIAGVKKAYVPVYRAIIFGSIDMHMALLSRLQAILAFWLCLIATQTV